MKFLLIVFAVILSFKPAYSGDAENIGKILFTHKCSVCHQLPDPDVFSPEQWQNTLRLMQCNIDKMGRTTLSQAEKEMILKFLTSEDVSR